MKTGNSILQPAPPFVIGASLLVWGWQNESFLAYSVLMALILESTRLVKWRWHISDREFNNIADASGVIFFITVVYIFATVRSQGIYTILSILPFVFFPITLTQQFSTHGTIKLSVLLISLRKLEQEQSEFMDKDINISLFYFIICLVSASAGNLRTPWFYILVCVLLACVLWSLRPHRYHFIIWIITVGVAVSIGYATQSGIRNAQLAIERSMMSIFDLVIWTYRDPDRSTTSIGSLGRLKASDRVLIRVKTNKPLTEPLYLHEATYDSYNYSVWSTASPSFTLIDPDIGGDSWTLNNLKTDKKASISTYMRRDTGVIPVPHGTSRITGNGVIEINQNNNGTVKMEIRRGWIRYNTQYSEGNIPLSTPREDDLTVANRYREDFIKLSNDLSLHDKTDEEILNIVLQHFRNNFQYSLERRQRFPRGKYLHHFLFESHQGHCEFFATSTVLLLRTMGIPARYAVGYYISEYSSLEGQYIGRSRHSHAWALAYINGSWQVVDTTPSTWAPYEEENASQFQGLFDIAGWIRYKFSRWQSRDELEDEEVSQFGLTWLLIPLTLILAWRLYIKERIQTRKKHRHDSRTLIAAGMDSDFFKLAKLIEDMGYKRREGETTLAWIKRIEPKISIKNINHALKLHYQYRFDPEGLSGQALIQLGDLVQDLSRELRKVVV